MRIKGVAPVAAGLSGIFAQSNLTLSLLLLSVAVADVVVDYFISHRLTTLVLERISGILEATYHCCVFPEGSDVRATVFASVRGGFLHQICPYYPTDKHSSYRRGIAVSKGIVGLCFRSGQSCVEVIGNPATFKKHMVDRWGLTVEEVDRMKARQSHFAIPIFDANRNAVGVAYFDSMRADAFAAESVDVLTKACVPLSKWVR